MYETLLSKVIRRQGELSDRAFAELLGLSNVQWSAVKKRQKKMGRDTLMAVGRVFPELQDDIDAYWMSLLQETSIAV